MLHGREHHLPPVSSFSFRDYAIAERALREGEKGQQSWSWWERKLNELPRAPTLPLRAKLPSGRSKMTCAVRRSVCRRRRGRTRAAARVASR